MSGFKCLRVHHPISSCTPGAKRICSVPFVCSVFRGEVNLFVDLLGFGAEFSSKGGGGVLEPKSPKVCAPKTAQTNISFCKCHWFPL